MLLVKEKNAKRIYKYQITFVIGNEWFASYASFMIWT